MRKLLRQLPLKVMIPIGVIALIITFLLKVIVFRDHEFWGSGRIAILIAFLLALILLSFQRAFTRRKD